MRQAHAARQCHSDDGLALALSPYQNSQAGECRIATRVLRNVQATVTSKYRLQLTIKMEVAQPHYWAGVNALPIALP